MNQKLETNIQHNVLLSSIVILRAPAALLNSCIIPTSLTRAGGVGLY